MLLSIPTAVGAGIWQVRGERAGGTVPSRGTFPHIAHGRAGRGGNQDLLLLEGSLPEMSSQAQRQLIFQANSIQILLAAESEKTARPKHKSQVSAASCMGHSRKGLITM